MRTDRLLIATALGAALSGLRPSVVKEIAVAEAMTRPGLGPQPNKYAPHQGKREMERRKRKGAAK